MKKRNNLCRTIASRPTGDNAGLVLAKLVAPAAYAPRYAHNLNEDK